MARNNEVIAKVRVTIGGVEASKQQLHALETSASLMKERITELNRQKLKFVDEGDVKRAAEVVKELRSIEADFKRLSQNIDLQKKELNNYVNILDNLSGTKLVHLQKGLRDLQTQMKQKLTLGDVERYGELKAAYDELLSSVDQLSGKVPNLTYVLKNIGQVANRTLADSITYTEKLIASTDKTTKRGRDNIKAWTKDLKSMRKEMEKRAFGVIAEPKEHSVDEVQQAVANLKKLQPVLKLNGKEWKKYAQHIKEAEEYLKSYENGQKQLAETQRKADTDSVLRGLSDPNNRTAFTTQQIQEAVKHGKELQSQLEHMGPEWRTYAQQIKVAEEALDAYNKEQKDTAKAQEEAQRKADTDSVLRGLSDPNNRTAFTTQQIQDAIKHGKELQSQLEHMSPQWRAYAQQIKVAEESLDAYNKELKETAKAQEEAQRKIATDALLPKLSDDDQDFTQQQLEDFIRNAKELQKNLTIGKDEWVSYAEGIKQAEQRLKSYDERQKRLDVKNAATTAIDESSTIRKDDGTFNITADEAKARVEAIQKYMGTLNMSDNAEDIRRATEALDIYNTALGKVKDTTVDVNAILDDPKNFSTEELQKAIKQLEETGLKIRVDDTDAIRKNIDDIEKLKTALADSGYSETFVDKVIKDAKTGEASVVELEKAIAMTKEKLRHTKDADMAEKLKQQLDRLNPALDLTKTSLSRVQTTLGNIKTSNLGSLKEAAERLKVELNDVNLEMADFAAKAAQLKKVKAQIKELEDQTNNTASAMEKAASRLQNWVLIYAGSQEIWNAVRRSFEGALQLSDAMSDVRKVTGLSADEVTRLSDEIQMLDSRVSNEKLMEAATEAGRIGLKTRKEVLDFTRASAITLTALDELDDRSITSVMKLNELLGETARLGVQQAILSTASSINELSMASSAAQQPIIDFSRRFGGIAAQANISTSQVLALGATIDALGQPIEMSSTALNKFTTALLSNGKQIAEDTGLSEEYVFQMTRQGKTIELMIEVLGKLNNMGGIGEIQKYMGDMGGEGARMTAVISALAANLGFLRQNLDLSNQSFDEGVSVINEYNLKNENAAALVARMGNEIKEVFTNSVTVKVVTFFVSLLQQVVHFLLSGSVAAKVINNALLLVIVRIATLNKTISAANGAILKHITAVKAGEKAWYQFGVTMTGVKTAVKSLGSAIAGVFKSNPLGWIAVGTSLLIDWIASMLSAEETTEELKDAVTRANESFEEESYKLNKLRDALEDVRREQESAGGSARTYAEIISTLNRDYGKHLGFVLDMAAGYDELTNAIELATEASRLNILQQEKDRNFQLVQDKYREQSNSAADELKGQIGIGSEWKGQFEGFSDEIQKELYYAIISDLGKTAATEGGARWADKTDEVIRRMAKTRSEALGKSETDLYARYMNRLNNITAIQKLAGIYNQKQAALVDMDKEVDVMIDTQKSVVLGSVKKQVELTEARNDLSNKQARDYTAEDEATLESIISQYKYQQKLIDKNVDKDEWDAIEEELEFFKSRQREVMLAFVENPLRGIKMKVGEDGKLYKEVVANGKYQYESVKELSDANLRQLVDAYRRTESTFQKLISDENHLMDSKVREQADSLSKVKTAINKELQKNGIDIDDKGNLKLRNTEYRDGSERTARQEESDMREAYQALLNNLKEFYEKKKQLALDDFLNGKATVEQKNFRIMQLEEEHNNMVIAMQNELLGETKDLNIFDEDAMIRDRAAWQKVLGLILRDTHHFQDKIRADRNKLMADNLKKTAGYKEEVDRILLGNDYQKQVDREMQAAFEKADLFWFGMENRTAAYANTIMAVLRHFSKDAYAVESSELVRRLQAHSVFGEDIKTMTKEQQAAMIVLLQQYFAKDVEARKKHLDEVRKIMEDRWKATGGKEEYDSGMEQVTRKSQKDEALKQYGAMSEREAFEERMKVLLEQLRLEERAYQQKVEQTNDEELLLELKREHAEREAEIQEELTAVYLEEYNRRAQKWTEHAQKFGEFAGVMASAAWNSVEDRKKAGEELLKYIAQETIEYLRELAVRKIKEEILQKMEEKSKKKHEEKKSEIEQEGVDTSIEITEIGGKIKQGVEEHIAGNISSIAESTAAKGAGLAVKKAQVDTAAGAASGASKTIAELGWWGIPLIAAIEGVLSMLLNMAFGALSSAFGSDSDTSKTSTKRLATGMLTYAEGRYPVQGDDGVVYNAQYEPRLQTKVYDGGKGKAHMALFSEVMPEMVVSGPTTKIIREDYPALMNAIMMIDKYGSLPQPKRMRRYADGNVGEFDVDMVQGSDGTYVESPALAELRQSNSELRDTVARLAAVLERGIHANINMYGTGGIKESMDKANKFYTKNRIK